MKTHKLWVHKADFGDEDLVINQEAFPSYKVGDLLEVYHPGDDFSRLLLQIGALGTLKGGVISIQENVAKLFQLRSHREVIVNKVNKKAVAVNHVELLLKDQYISRNDMWRMRESLVNTCVYRTKKLNFCGIRAQVCAVYSGNTKVMCGMISENTRVVYRSASAAMLLLIQMSCEMWEFNNEGDLYFETAVNGFFTELISNWKEQECHHDVTIALFSRTFYPPEAVEHMPRSFVSSLQRGKCDMYYEDFYQVVVDSETRLDWSGMLVQLKKAFHDYKKCVNCHEDSNPRGFNSSAMEGNILEAINLGLDVYSRHYVDRNFERTGQQVVVVSPGVGVFKTCREMRTLTKVRVINSCIGADLICLSEQPMHAVPLLMVTSNDTEALVQYDIPQWINHSFYTPPRSDRNTTFVPCIRIPGQFSQIGLRPSSDEPDGPAKPSSVDVGKMSSDSNMVARFDYDDYDARVFAYHPNASKHESTRRRFFSNDSLVDAPTHTSSDLVDALTSPPHSELHRSTESLNILSRSPRIKVHSFDEGGFSPRGRLQTGAATLPGSLPRNVLSRSQTEKTIFSKAGQRVSLLHHIKSKPFINPFCPEQCAMQRTTDVYRWRHAFPHDPEGRPCRDHHGNVEARQRAMRKSTTRHSFDEDSTNRQMTEKVSQACQVAVEARLRDRFALQNDDEPDLYNIPDQDADWKKKQRTHSLVDQKPKRTSSVISSKPLKSGQNMSRSSESHFEEVTVDWKSLCSPACLPITTDFFPDRLHEDYVEALYSLYYDDDQWEGDNRPAETAHEAAGHPDLSEKQIFRELLLQRLGQDFQLITSKKEGTMTRLHLENGVEMPMRVGLLAGRRPWPTPQHCAETFQQFPLTEGLDLGVFQLPTVYWVTLGRHFHCLQFNPPVIHVTRYKPRHPYEARPIPYTYNLCQADSRLFERRGANFSPPNLDEYNWNYLDQYVCGDQSFANLLDSLKYWRCRFLLLPMQANTPGSSLTNTPRRGSALSTREEHIRAFIRFIELLNRIRRPLKERFLCPGTDMKRSASALDLGLSSSQMSLDVISQTPADRDSPTSQSSAVTPVELSENASAEEIWRAMQSKGGVELLEGAKELPPRCFLSVDAVDWLIEHLPRLSQRHEASDMLQRVLDEGYIEHASGDPSLGFIDGTYIYHLLTAEEQAEKKAKQGGGLLQMSDSKGSALEKFENLWYEVSVEGPLPEGHNRHQANYQSPRDPSPQVDTGEGWQQRSEYYRRNAPLDYHAEAGASMKSMVLQSHAHSKSDRHEWCVVHYNNLYRPNCVFNFHVHWMVATACLIREAMIQSWIRKAVSCGFTLLPAPANPIQATQYHPFRSVQFVPLCLGEVLLEEEKDGASLSDVLSLQTRLLGRLSFLPDVSSGVLPSDPDVLRQNLADVPTMVHVTAVAFAQPAVELCAPTVNWHNAQLEDDEEEDEKELPSSPTGLELTAIAWHKLGFSFYHNFMLTRKWRSSSQPDTGTAAKALCSELEQLCSDKSEIRSLWDALPRYEQLTPDNDPSELLEDTDQSGRSEWP